MRYAAVRRRPLLAALLLPMLGACGESTGPGVSLHVARARWEAREPAAYRMTVERICYCAVEGPVEVVVRDGAVASLRLLRTGEPLGIPLDARFAASYTVDGLFQTIEEDAVQLEVAFDPHRGYPVRIMIDGRHEIADDELTVLVGDFAPL